MRIFAYRRWGTRRRRVALGVATAALSLGMVVGAFAVGRTLGSGEVAVAQDGEDHGEGVVFTDPPGPEVMPDPLATPDTSVGWWYIPYQNREDLKPRHEQVVAGIRVGPGVERERQCSAPVGGPPDETLRFSPKYLPAEAALFDTQEGACYFGLEYGIISDPDASYQIATGEKSYFEVNHGGKIDIYRLRAGPAFESNIASERWREGVVAGRPAAIGAPIIDAGTGTFAGMGPSIVIVHEDGILTAIRGDEISLAELLKIAEGVFE